MRLLARRSDVLSCHMKSFRGGCWPRSRPCAVGISWRHSGPCVSYGVLHHRLGMYLLCRCQALLGTAWTHFRENWSGLHPLSQASRHDAVASLQPLAEIQVDYS